MLTTIPGPGFTYALSGLAEARADSAAVLYVALTVNQASRPFTLQLLDQKQVVRSLVKGVIEVASPGELVAGIRRAAALALADEPGPVVVELPSEFLLANAGLVCWCRPWAGLGQTRWIECTVRLRRATES